MTLVIAFALAPLIILTACFAVEILTGLRPLAQNIVSQQRLLKTAMIVPAHNEAEILQDRLSSLKTAAHGIVDIILVADNCTDTTAQIGRDLGVVVIERNDPEQRGKGFALEFARGHLEIDPPDTVIVVDADCFMDRQSLRHLISECAATDTACQATNLQVPAADSSPVVQISTFAFFVKNVIRQRGLQRLAGRAHLLGTGMAFPWTIFERANLATGDIVEDLKLGQELGQQGLGPRLVEQARVLSAAESGGNTLSQRRRWEGGFISNALRVGPGLLGRSLLRLDAREIWAALNLMVPPLALLILLDVTFLALASAITWLFSASVWPILALFFVLIIACGAMGLAWRAGGSQFVTLGALARAPLYVLWKMPMYLRFAKAGAPQDWVRTARSEPVGGLSKDDLPLR